MIKARSLKPENKQVSFSLPKCLSILAVALLAACSDTGQEGSFTPFPLVEPAEFTFLADGALYNFYKDGQDSGRTVKLIEPESGLMVLLDVDDSAESGADPSNTFLERSMTPEFAVYVENQTIFALELATLHKHRIFDFQGENVAVKQVICDIQPVVGFDQKNFDQREIVLKDEIAIYVRASNIDCDSTSESDYRHYRVDFETDRSRQYAIRREELVRKEESELSSEPELQIVTKRLLELKGVRSIVDRALMYARAPILDTRKKRAGYLGFDASTLTWSFYIIGIEDNTTRKLWELQDDGFAAQADDLSVSAFPVSTFATLNQRRNFWRINEDTISLFYGDSISLLAIDNVFDDDRNGERSESLQNPLFTFTSTSGNRHAILENGVWYFQDGARIYTLDSDGNAQLLRDYTLENLQDLRAQPVGETIPLLKAFSDGQISVTALDANTRLEKTLIAKNNHIVRGFNDGQALFVDQFRSGASSAVLASYINPESGSSLNYPHGMWSTIISAKGTPQTNQLEAIAIGNTSQAQPQSGEYQIEEPTLAYFDLIAGAENAGDIAVIPGLVDPIDLVAEYDEEYGLIHTSKIDRSRQKIYYFDPEDLPADGDDNEETDSELQTAILIYDSDNPPQEQASLN